MVGSKLCLPICMRFFDIRIPSLLVLKHRNSFIVLNINLKGLRKGENLLEL